MNTLNQMRTVFFVALSFTSLSMPCFAEAYSSEEGDAELTACFQRVEAKYHRDVKKCGVKGHFECAKEILDREGIEFELCREDSSYLK